MHATCLVCTLKRSPEPSNAESLAEVVLGALREQGVTTDTIRLADHQIDPGVVSEAVSDGDEWPAIRERVLKADILLVATPTWLGQPSSVSKRALERMDALISETKEDGETPIAYDRVAGVVVVGNEDGAHHVTAEVMQALNDVGFSIPAAGGTYWVGEATFYDGTGSARGGAFVRDQDRHPALHLRCSHDARLPAPHAVKLGARGGQRVIRRPCRRAVIASARVRGTRRRNANTNGAPLPTA